MRLLVLEIEVRPNCWPSFCKAFPQFSHQLGNRWALSGAAAVAVMNPAPGGHRSGGAGDPCWRPVPLQPAPRYITSAGVCSVADSLGAELSPLMPRRSDVLQGK